jgi:hypothetical protein
MYGVVDGIYYCNLNRDSELNERISSRNVPSAPLQSEFSVRPVSTKYEILPIFDRRPQPVVTIQRQLTYNIQTTFNPGSAQAPWSGFSTNINDESQLRNQFFALQKNPQAAYIPPSTSDMFQVNVDSGIPITQPFTELFKEHTFEQLNTVHCNIGQKLFDNSTRQQVKELKN